MLTNAQKSTLKAHILANTDPYVVEQLAAGSVAGPAEWYSQTASPAFIVWRSRVGANEILNAVTFSGAGGLIGRSVAERDTFSILLARGELEPWRSNMRQAISDIFSGSGTGAPETRSAILAISKRSSLNIEKVFATGTGSDASPATLVWEGPIDGNDIASALEYTG